MKCRTDSHSSKAIFSAQKDGRVDRDSLKEERKWIESVTQTGAHRSSGSTMRHTKIEVYVLLYSSFCLISIPWVNKHSSLIQKSFLSYVCLLWLCNWFVVGFYICFHVLCIFILLPFLSFTCIFWYFQDNTLILVVILNKKNWAF